MKDFQHMSLQQMVDENVPIYVRNRSARQLDKSHMLVIEFPNPAGGRGSTVVIPAIKYPIDISRKVAPPAAIPMSRAFVDWLNKGVLELVDPDEARRILAKPEVRAAVAAAYEKLNRKRGAGLQRKRPQFKVRHGGARETRSYADLDSEMSAKSFYGDTPEEAKLESEIVAPQEALTLGEADAKVSPKIKQFCADLLEEPELKKDFLTELKSWDEDELSDEELGYMMQNLAAFENIAAYLRSLMAQRATTKAEAKPKKKARKPRRSAPPPSELDDLGDDWPE